MHALSSIPLWPEIQSGIWSQASQSSPESTNVQVFTNTSIMLLRAQPYNFTVTFCPGKEIPVANALSHLYLPEEETAMQKEIESYIHSVMLLLPISNCRLKKLIQETTTDAQMIVLAKIFQNSWLEAKRPLSLIISSFWDVRHDQTIIDNIILKGDRLVIPKSSRKEILNCIHASHLSIKKIKQPACSVAFWLGMT